VIKNVPTIKEKGRLFHGLENSLIVEVTIELPIGKKGYSVCPVRRTVGINLECAPLTGEKNRELEGGVIGPTSG